MLDTFAHKYLLAIRLLLHWFGERNPSGEIYGLDRFDLHQNSLTIHQFHGRFLFPNLPARTPPTKFDNCASGRENNQEFLGVLTTKKRPVYSPNT